jgi:hypothetical protein
VLIALMQWGDRWQQERGAPVEIHHAGCGGRVSVELRCDHDHAVDDDQLQLVRPARRPRSAE